MSELTAYNSVRIYWAVEQVEDEAGDIDTLHLDDNLFYLKSEVDKVIAELKEEIEEQKRLRDMALASVPNILKVMKIIQHHKYKRCLAMADFCESQHHYYETLGNSFWLVCGDIETRDKYRKKASDFWWKWHKRWFELAEKFKPTNSTAQQGKG